MRETIYLSLLVFLFFLSSNCCIMPIPIRHTVGEHAEIDTSFIIRGITTKEDIFLRLGDVMYVSQEEKLMTYQWTICTGYLFLFLFHGGRIDSYETYYLVEIEFDDNDVVKEFRTWKGERTVRKI